jgi:hypothetical protein
MPKVPSSRVATKKAQQTEDMLRDDPLLHGQIKQLVKKYTTASGSHSFWTGYQDASDLQAQPLYAGLGGLTEFQAPDLAKDMVQTIGADHGCHTCNSKIAVDANQPWIGDHQPPTKLSTAARAALGFPAVAVYGAAGNVKLYPQCSACAARQSGLIKQINANPAMARTPAENALLGLVAGQFTRFTAVDAVSSSCSGPQGDLIQSQGQQHGCHSCPNTLPAQRYHADHNPPVWASTPSVRDVLKLAREKLGLRVRAPDKYTYLPHCPRCSSAQGGGAQGLAEEFKTMHAKLFG